MKNYKSAAAKLPVLAQLCKLIPPCLSANLAKKHGIDKQARPFSGKPTTTSRTPCPASTT